MNYSSGTLPMVSFDDISLLPAVSTTVLIMNELSTTTGSLKRFWKIARTVGQSVTAKDVGRPSELLKNFPVR